MTTEISRATGTPNAFTLRLNPCASRSAPWRPEQDAILSDAGLKTARATISGWPGYAPTPLVTTFLDELRHVAKLIGEEHAVAAA